MRFLSGLCIGLMLFCLAPSAWAFRVVTHASQLVRWPQSNVTYSIQRNALNYVDTSAFADDAPEAVIQTAIHASFRSWQNVGADMQFHFAGMSEVEDTGSDGENTLTWIGNNWNRRSYGASRVIAVTMSTYKTGSGHIVDSDIHFNATNYCWQVRDSNLPNSMPCMDVQNIATHEIGHFIGLDHSSEDIYEPRPELSEAAMFFASYAGDITRRLLNLDDQRAILSHYPYQKPAAPEVMQIDPPLANNNESRFLLRISGTDFLDTSMVRLYHPQARMDLIGVIEELNNDSLLVAFNLNGMPPGDLQVLVNNSYNSMAKSSTMLHLDGDEVEYSALSEPSAGGCGVFYVIPPEGESTVMHLTCLLLALIILITQRWRLAKWLPAQESGTAPR